MFLTYLTLKTQKNTNHKDNYCVVVIDFKLATFWMHGATSETAFIKFFIKTSEEFAGDGNNIHCCVMYNCWQKRLSSPKGAPLYAKIQC